MLGLQGVPTDRMTHPDDPPLSCVRLVSVRQEFRNLGRIHFVGRSRETVAQEDDHIPGLDRVCHRVFPLSATMLRFGTDREEKGGRSMTHDILPIEYLADLAIVEQVRLAMVVHVHEDDLVDQDRARVRR